MKSTRRKAFWLLFALVVSVPEAVAQVTIPNAFVADTIADPDQVNANFNQLGTQALNRTGGGVVTGNITVDPGVTIDGVDISAALGGAGGPTFSAVTISGAGANALDVTGGITAGSGNVGIIDTTGRIPALSSIYFASLDGSNLTNISAAQLLSGTLPDARLSANIPRLNAVNGFSEAGTHLFSAGVNGNNEIQIRNTMSGTVATAGLVLGNNMDANISSLRAFSAGYTTVGSGIPASTRLRNVGAGGISLDATDAAAPIRFYTGGSGALAGQWLSTRQLQLVVGAQLEEVAAAPANPTASDELNIYLKGDFIVFQFNDAGTVRYKYLNLTGTGTTWQQSTTTP